LIFNKNKKKLKIQDMIVISMLSAIGLVLYRFMKIPIYGELSANPADVAALIGGVLISPVAAIFITFVRCMLKIIVFGTSSFATGEVIDFILGTVLSVSFLFFYNFLEETKTKNIVIKKFNVSKTVTFAITVLISEIIMLAAAFLTNTIIIPVYFKIMGMEFTKALLFAWIFNAGLTTTLRVIINCGIFAFFIPFTRIFKKILKENQ
jgi:riboflavin transporter FmnP